MKITLLVVLAGSGIAIAGLVLVLRHGFKARDQPSALDALGARTMRHLAIPSDARAATNPLPSSPVVVAEGRAHFADHCAICYANDGSGDTEIGRNLYPKVPDMRRAATAADIHFGSALRHHKLE
jgi:hypothetical protein